MKCPTEDECPDDSEWRTIYTSDDIDYPADNADSLEEQPFMKGYMANAPFGEENDEKAVEEYEGEGEGEENYDALRATMNRFNKIKIEVLGVTESSRCCIERKCVCRDCPPMPKCNENYVTIVVHPAQGVPGECCAKYDCIPNINCENDDQKPAQEFWRDACTKCKCFGNQPFCQKICRNDEDEQFGNCFSEYLNLPMAHNSTWFEDGFCSECTCTHGERGCVTKRCNDDLDCKNPIKRPSKCCPECPDQFEPINVNAGRGTGETIEADTSSTTESIFSTESSSATHTSIATTELHSTVMTHENSTTTQVVTITESPSSMADDMLSNSTLTTTTGISTTSDEPNPLIDNSTGTNTENSSTFTIDSSVDIDDVERSTTTKSTGLEQVSWTTESTTKSDATTTSSLKVISTTDMTNSTVDVGAANSFFLSRSHNSTSTTQMETTSDSTVEDYKTETAKSSTLSTKAENETENVSQPQSTTVLHSSTQQSSTAETTASDIVSETSTAANIVAITSVFFSRKAEATTSAPNTSNSNSNTDTTINSEISTSMDYTQLTHAPTTTSAPAPLEPQPTIYRPSDNGEDFANAPKQHSFFSTIQPNTSLCLLVLLPIAIVIACILGWWVRQNKHQRKRGDKYDEIPKSETMGYNTGIGSIATTDMNHSTKERKYYSTTPKSECSLSANSTSASVLTVESG